MVVSPNIHLLVGGTFQIFLEFSPRTLGKMNPFLTHIFSIGLKPPTRLTWHWKITIFNRKCIHLHSWWIFPASHVSFRSCIVFFLFWGGVGSQCNIKNQLLPSELSMIQMEVIYPLKSKTAKRVTWKQLEIIFYSWLINQAILFDLFGTLKRDSQRLSDLQLGDKKVTLNHMGCCFFLFGGGPARHFFWGGIFVDECTCFTVIVTSQYSIY